MRRQKVKARRPPRRPPPPNPRHHRPACVSRRVPRIAGRSHDMRPDHLEQNRPSRPMRRDFPHRGHGPARSQPQRAMRQQQRRQGARNEESVVEPRMEKLNVAMRLDPPAIGRIQPATHQKKRIKNVPEPPHNKARMIRPKPKPSNTFSSRILDNITQLFCPVSKPGQARIAYHFPPL